MVGRIARRRNLRPIIVTQLMDNPQNVVVSGTAYLELPIGLRYHALHLVYGGTTFDPTHMSGIRVKANKETIHDLTGARRDVINQFDKLPAASTHKTLTIPFERLGMVDQMQRYFTALNTGIKTPFQAPNGISSLRLEVDIDSGASAPTLSVYADVSDVNPDQALALMRELTNFENVAATGEYTHVNKYNADPLKPVIVRWGFLDTDTNITAFRFLSNGSEIINRTSALNEHVQSIAGIRTFTASDVIYDTGERGNANSVLRLGNVASFQVKTTHAAANANLPVYYQSEGVLAA